MIAINAPSKKSARATDSRSVLADLMQRTLARGLKSIRSPHFKFSESGFSQVCKDVSKKEASLHDTVHSNVLRALAELRRQTPVLTGGARDGWALEVTGGPGSRHYTIVHNNMKLINMLNYGTKPHVIKAKSNGRLHFYVGDKEVFAPVVKHPGTRALGFVDRVRNKLLTSVGVK